MLLSDFDYELLPERIAAFPPKDRSSARLLKVDRATGAFSHHTFRDIETFLKAGDVLVLNNTKVLPARIFGKRPTGGKVEALLLKETAPNEWEALLRPGGRIKKGIQISFGDLKTELVAEVLDDSHPDSGARRIRFSDSHVKSKLKKIGHIPLPPYIDRPDSEIDRELYQTVFAKEEGAVASPTAGLHFDEKLLKQLEKKGVEIIYVTLHTSYGTFQPIGEEDFLKHKMFAEDFEVTESAAEKINRALEEGRRVIACGTTSVRTLESASVDKGRNHFFDPKRGQTRGSDPFDFPVWRIQPMKGQTRLFIYPGYEFKVVKGIITNFHLPKSSLLLLVAAFLGLDKMKAAYAEAIKENYRFYSYGDAMLIE